MEGILLRAAGRKPLARVTGSVLVRAGLVAGAPLLLPEEEEAAERGEARSADRRPVGLAALDRGHGRLGLLLRHTLADVPRQPAEHGVALVDDPHRLPFSRPWPAPCASAAGGSP